METSRWHSIKGVLRNGQAVSYLLSLGLWMGWPAVAAEQVFAPTTIQECLEATVRIKITDASGKDSYGSGFFLNEGQATYIYTNAHVIDGAEKIELVDFRGGKVTGIEWIEAFAEPFGRFDDGLYSGDGVRMKLNKRRDVALTLASDWTSLVQGSKLVVLGDDDGAITEVLSGTLLTNSNGILRYDFKVKSGSSGGAILDPATLKVVALNTWSPTTWGPKNQPPDIYKRVLGIEEGGGLGFGVVLRNPVWKKFSTKDYLAQKKVIQRLRKNIELMILLSYLVPMAPALKAPIKDPAPPTSHGVPFRFQPAGGDEFVAGMKFSEAFVHHQDNPLMKKLMDLSDSGMKISSTDIFKTYIATFDAILKERDAMREDLQKDKLSYYHQSLLHKRRLTAGDLNYSVWLMVCQAWFKQKSTLGKTMPPEEWATLPPCGLKLATEIGLKLQAE